MTDKSNYIYLAMTMNSWATSPDSEADALQSLAGYAGLSTIKKYGYVTYHVHPDCEISQIDGTVYTKAGHPAIKLTDKVKRIKAKTA